MEKIILDNRYRINTNGDLQHVKRNKPLSRIDHNCGYIQYTIYDLETKKYKIYLAHRLVAEAFISNPLNKKFVNHKNGNKKDNRVCNLEWVTRQENEDHAFKTGLKNSTGVNNKMSKLNDIKVIEIRKRCKDSKDVKILAEKFGVHRATIQRIVNRKIWNHIEP
jgi:hypothetical protein